MAFYRGQTTTQQKIQAITTLRITTKAEAIAFLRAISNIELQIADVLQRSNMQEIAARNQTVKPIEEAKAAQEPAPVAPEQQELPLNFEEEEAHTEDQKKTRVAKLKKATKK